MIENKNPEKKWHGDGKGIAFPSFLHITPIGNGLKQKKSAKVKQKHINQTPQELWEKFIDYMCPKDGVICDPCMGLGSVGLAVQTLNKHVHVNRTYIGMEIMERNFKKAYLQLFPEGGFF